VKGGTVKPVRCAIYTRVSTDHGLEQDFNSLDAQHDAAQAYIRSQAHAGWTSDADLSLRPKNLGPDQRVPVMAKATLDRLG